MRVERHVAASGRHEASIAMFVCEEDRPRVASLLGVLRDAGIDLPIARPDRLSGFDILVVVVSSALEKEKEVLETLRAIQENNETQVIPLLLEDAHGTNLFSDLSQVRLASGVHEAARILDLVLRVGPQHLVPWKGLVSQSRTWVDGGRSVGGLLDRSDTRLATLLLTEPIAGFDAEGARSLRELVLSSRRRLRASRYKQFLAATITAIVLLVVGIVAADQQRSAEAARTEADRSASFSESSRISDLAISYAEHDPDIPWILAADANQISPDPEIATTAAVRVMASVPVHRSLHLGHVPAGASVAESGVVAISYHEGLQFDLADLGAMELVKTFESVEKGELSRSGTRLALLRPGAEVEVLALADEDRWSSEVSWQGVEAFHWHSDDSLMIAQGEKLSLIHLDSSGTLSWVIPEAVQPVVDMASDDTSLFVLGPEHLAVFDLGSEEGDARVQQVDPGAESIAASGGRVYVQFANRVSLPVGIAANGDHEVSSRTMSVVSMVPVGEEWIATTSSFGQILLLDARDLSLKQAIASHRGVGWGVDYSPGWGLVSVGGDMQLRVWEIDPTMRSVGADHGVTSRYDNARFRDSNRHQLQTTEDPHRVNLTHIDTDTGFVLDRSNLETISEGHISLHWETTLPTRTEGLFVTLFRDREEVLIVDTIGSGTRAIPFEFGILPNMAMIAADERADAIAVATITDLYSWTAPRGWATTRFESERDVILLEIDGSGGVVVMDSRGIGQSPSGPWELNLLEDQRLTAIVRVGSSSHVVVDSDGILSRFDSSDGEVIGSVGVDANAFDLHVSASGNLVAAIGPTETRFFSIEDQRIVAEMPPEGGAPVVDLLFDEQGSSGIYVRSNGVIGRFDVPEDLEELLGTVQVARPRLLTENEEQTLAVDRNG